MEAKILVVALATTLATRALAAGAVFTMSDEVTGNTVVAFSRSADGALTLAGTYPTGGLGSGGGEGVLGSQGAISLSTDGGYLLVVNAGSDEVTSFRVDGARLVRTGLAPSGGQLPVSVTEHHGVVYVLNAGGTGNISGLSLDEDGGLHPIAGSTQTLGNAGVGPAQVAFDAEGEQVAVTEKTGAIAIFPVGRDGRAAPPRLFPSAGRTPFGFSFTRQNVLIVSEAAGGAPGASTVSSYDADEGALRVVSAAVPDHQQAACWLVTTTSGRWAFVSNAGSGTISSYRIDRSGSLSLSEGIAGQVPGGKTLDLALSSGDRFLYVLDANHGAVQGFAVGSGGALSPLGAEASGLPAHAVGLVSR